MTSLESLEFQASLKPNKGKIQSTIFCTHCKKDSGWTNDEVAKVPTDVERNLKCQSCGGVCVRIKPRALVITEEVNRTIKPYKQKI